MALALKTRKNLQAILKGVDYRKIVSDRVKCHPNTVSNVLLNGNDNPLVELELMILAQEVKQSKDDIEKRKARIAKQL